MLFLVAAFLVFGILVGTAAHVPLPVTLVAAAVIGAWLLAFRIHERHRHGRHH